MIYRWCILLKKEKAASLKFYFCQGFERKNSVLQNQTTMFCEVKLPLQQLNQSLQWMLAGGVVVSAKIYLDSNVAKCEAKIEPAPILEKIKDTNESINDVILMAY